MLWRAFTFILCQLVGGVLGWWLARERGALVGVMVGGVGWFIYDLLRATKLLHWLRRGDAAAAPALRGVWGEAADRMRRGLRAREQATQDALQRLQDFLAAIQASPNGVVLLDASGHIEWCNQPAAEHLGIDPERDLQQLIGNLLRDPVFAAYYAGGDYGRDVTILGRGTSPARPTRLSVQLHPYGGGRKLLLSRDITALEQAETMRRDFVANVSHEIRTPLTVLAGFIETLQTLALQDDERDRYLGLMLQQAHRMQTLVNDLLTLSRLEGSPLPGPGEWTRVDALMAHCEQEARALSGVLAKAHAMRFEFVDDAEISGAHSELLSALSNLVSNAVRYTPPRGEIVVRWQVLSDGRGGFFVRDSGPGIAPEHIPRLTERFYRVDRSRSRETGGTGLGLAIVKHVVQRHGGELRIDSVPGVGSTFAIVFPAARVRAVLNAAPGGASERRATAAR